MNTTIDGLTVTPLQQIADDRGAVLHMLRADAVEFRAFGEVYFSEVNPGTVKGWKRHRRQSQNLAVPVGRVRFVIYDDRPLSHSKGILYSVELGRPDDYVRLHIPPMLWYGFKCISMQPSLVANCADIPHDPAESDVLGLDMLELPRALEVLRNGVVRS